MSYLGISLDFVKEIHAVQAIKPYTNKIIAMKEGAKTILGKCFSSQLDITNIRKLTVPIKIGTVIQIYLLTVVNCLYKHCNSLF